MISSVFRPALCTHAEPLYHFFLRRDPDPLGSLENQTGVSSSVSKDNGNGTTKGSEAGEDAAAWRSSEGIDVSGTSNGHSGNDAAVCTTPDRERYKHQRRSSPSCSSSSPKPEPGGSAPVVTHGEGLADAVAAMGDENNSSSSCGENGSSASVLSGDRGSHHGSLHTVCSFHPNSPLPAGDSFSSIVNAAETARQSVAAAGGSAGNGDVWGGGALVKTMSEGATQVRFKQAQLRCFDVDKTAGGVGRVMEIDALNV